MGVNGQNFVESKILDIGLKKVSAKYRWNWSTNKNFKPRDILHNYETYIKPMVNHTVAPPYVKLLIGISPAVKKLR